MCHDKVYFANCFCCIRLKTACTAIALLHMVGAFLLLATDEHAFVSSDSKKIRHIVCISSVVLSVLFMYVVLKEKYLFVLVYGYICMLLLFCLFFELFCMAAIGPDGYEKIVSEKYQQCVEKLFYTRGFLLNLCLPFNAYFVAIIFSYATQIKVAQALL